MPIRTVQEAHQAVLRDSSNLILGVLAQQYEYGLLPGEVQRILVDYMMQDHNRCVAVLGLADTHNWPQRLDIAKKIATSPEHARRAWGYLRESLSIEVADIICGAIKKAEINETTGYYNLGRGDCW